MSWDVKGSVSYLDLGHRLEVDLVSRVSHDSFESATVTKGLKDIRSTAGTRAQLTFTSI